MTGLNFVLGPALVINSYEYVWSWLGRMRRYLGIHNKDSRQIIDVDILNSTAAAYCQDACVNQGY